MPLLVGQVVLRLVVHVLHIKKRICFEGNYGNITIYKLVCASVAVKKHCTIIHKDISAILVFLMIFWKRIDIETEEGLQGD